MKDKDKLLLVAEEENSIVGFVLALIQETLPYDCLVKHTYVYLADIAVNSHFRGKGIGSKLLDTVKEWGKRKNAHHLELNVLAENILAEKLYLREKFTVSSKTMKFIL